MNKIFSILVLVLFATVLARPCGRCLPEAENCGAEAGGDCQAGTTCDRLNNGATSICLPTVSIGEACDGKAYDPCPSRTFCHPDTLTCQLSTGIADFNDGCTTDDDCKGVLTCSNGLCTSDLACYDPTLGFGEEQVGCPIGSFCDLTDIDNPVCADLPVDGEDCTGSCWKANCRNGTCRAYYQGVEGAECDSTQDCQSGLECSSTSTDPERLCRQPVYLYLQQMDFTAKWGDVCDAGNNPGDGCTCNYATKQEQYLIEASVIVPQACINQYDVFYDCLKENQCYDIDTFENSCLRRNCYSQFTTAQDVCVVPSQNPPRCSAGTFVLAFALLVLVLFLH